MIKPFKEKTSEREMPCLEGEIVGWKMTALITFELS